MKKPGHHDPGEGCDPEGGELEALQAIEELAKQDAWRPSAVSKGGETRSDR